jgi:hypothetical protein
MYSNGSRCATTRAEARISLAVFFLGLVAAYPAAAAPPPTVTAAAGAQRLAEPAAAEIEAALAQVQDIFSAEYAAAKPPEAKSKLAKQLASHATPDQSPASRTALLREAVRLAVEAGDVKLALEAAEKMTAAFDVDRDATMLEVYQSLLRTASPAAARDLGQSILKFADEAMRSGRNESLEKAVPLLLSVSRKARDPLLVKAAAALKLRLAEKAALDGRVAPLRAKLAEAPNDPQANLELGQLLCFTADSWEEGLPYLAEGNEGSLATLAAAEIQAGEPPAPKAALALADGWYDWSQGQKGSLRTAAESRSLNFYLAASGQVTGLEGVRIGKRIAELEKNTGFKRVSTPLGKLEAAETSNAAGPFCRKGRVNAIAYTVQAREWPTALYLPPTGKGPSIIRYDLPGKHRRLQGKVGVFTMPDSPPTRQPGSPIVFRIVGDGRQLWQSPPLAKRDQMARYSVDISDVITLELHTETNGSAFMAWGAWLDPELVE